jgi:glycosyltransferase involved in cell wall biosynthesis
VIYPPVDLGRFTDVGSEPPEEWFLVVSRLVPHKRVDLAIEAAASAGVPLKIIGTGRSRPALEAQDKGNVEFLGQVDDDALSEYLKRCRALILPATEDFGMTSIEAQAAGRPVIAFGNGGALESIREGETGLFFREATVEALTAAIRAFDGRTWSASLCRANAQRFSKEVFLAGIDEEIELALRQRRLINVA